MKSMTDKQWRCVEMAQHGRAQKAIARDVGWSKQQVSKVLIDFGFGRQRNPGRMVHIEDFDNLDPAKVVGVA